MDLYGLPDGLPDGPPDRRPAGGACQGPAPEGGEAAGFSVPVVEAGASWFRESEAFEYPL